MPGIRKDIQKEATSNCYGGRRMASGVVKALGEWYFCKGSEIDAPKDEVCINGRFAYAIKRMSMKAGRVKTEAYR